MKTRGSFITTLGAFVLAGCGGNSVASWASPASAYIPPSASQTPAGSPTSAPSAAPSAAPTSSPAPGAVTTQWGIQLSPADDPNQALPLLRQLRPAWIHVLYDANTADGFVGLGKALGCGVFFITNQDTGTIVAAAQKYANLKIAWDILNEPDITLTQAGIAPIDYVALVNTMGGGIKSVAPNHLICVASCSGKQSTNPQWYTTAFGNGLLSTVADAIGFHPYGGGQGPNGDPPFTLIANGYRGLVLKYGGKQQVWNTEWGQSSATEPQAPQMQSWADSLRGLVQMAVWIGFRDASTSGSREDSFGIVDYNYNPKTVFSTAVSVFGS